MPEFTLSDAELDIIATKIVEKITPAIITAMKMKGNFIAARAAGDTLTIHELADRWNVPYLNIQRAVKNGRIPAIKHGRQYRIQLCDIENAERSGNTAVLISRGR